jgi:hypothetical protein
LPTHLSFREIGERLYISRHTVKTQAISVYRKLGVASRSEAIDRVEAIGPARRLGNTAVGRFHPRRGDASRSAVGVKWMRDRIAGYRTRLPVPTEAGEPEPGEPEPGRPPSWE